MTARIGARSLLWAVVAVALGCGGVQHYNPTLLRAQGGSGSAEVPQDCGANAGFGSVGPGALVVLWPHRSVAADRNWIAGMVPYVGQTTQVTAQAGRDPQGCPVVQVALDQGRFNWRARDLTLIGRELGPGGGDAVPQRCFQDEDTADFGLIQPGAQVVLNRHRPVEGETNWTPEMADHVGQVATVTDIGAVDVQGCPVFHADIDRGEWAWRVRDVILVRAALPQRCGMASGEDGLHGALTVGAVVRLNNHRPVRGEQNWVPSMAQYVDREARVTSLGPPDDQGCPIVHVDLDRGARPWRVRDLVLLERQPSATAASPSAPDQLSTSPTEGTDADGIPQGCGQSAASVSYGSIRLGARVVLGRHRQVGETLNWSEEMEPFVGREATVTRLSGVDSEGCPGVRVDADNEGFFWRIRDLRLAE